MRSRPPAPVSAIDRCAGLEAAFNPHLVINPDYRKGTVRCEFDLRMEEGAVLLHEWRDWSVTPYLVGPSLWVQQGGLQVNGQTLLSVPLGQWIHVVVEAEVGEQATGKWSLTVTLPGQAAQRFGDLAVGSPNWTKMTWVGFTSNAIAKTVFYLDDLQLGLQAD